MAPTAKVSDVKDLPGRVVHGMGVREFVGEGNSMNLTALYIEIDPSGQAPRNHHKIAEEIAFVIQGSGTLELDGVLHELRAGTIIYIPPGTNHHVIAGPDGLRVLALMTPPVNEKRDLHLSPLEKP